MWKKIDSATDAQPYIDWARKNYTPMMPIQGVWHPVTQAECVIMNIEAGKYEGRWPVVDLP